MPLLASFDSRTLMACEILLALTFAIKFLSLGRLYPKVRGVRTVAVSFALIVLAHIVILLHGFVRSLVSIVIGSFLLLLAANLMYDGLAEFFGARRLAVLRWGTAALCIGIIFYYSEVRNSMAPRVVAIALDMALVRGLIAFTALLHAKRSPSRPTMITLGGIMAILATSNFAHAFLAMLHGTPFSQFESDPLQAIAIFQGLIFVSTIGICFFILIAHNLITHSQVESEHDPVSGALNRRGIENRLTRTFETSAQLGKKVFVALIDIDHFKAVNDTLGHAAGDAALRSVAQAISTQLRATDYFGRYGGDEFLLLLNRITCEEAVTVANRLNQTVKSLYVSDRAVPLTISIGLTEMTPADDTISLVQRADQALYQAKREGRNCAKVVLPPSATPISKSRRPATSH